MSGSNFDGKLKMDSIDISQHLFMRNNATFKDVAMGSAKIGGQLDMSGSNFDGKLNMNSIDISQSLYLRDNAIFKDVDMNSAKIGGQLDMSYSKFDGELVMESIEIDKELYMRSSFFHKDQEIILYFSKIGSNFDLSDTTIGSIDLTASIIVGEFRLGSSRGHYPTKWVGSSKMILRNTCVGTIQDAHIESDSWPQNLEMDGFEYLRLGGFGAEGLADIANRDSSWYKQWLDRDKTFSPQPYEQLAKILRGLGFPSKANEILYAGRMRSRREACFQKEGKPRELARWFGLTLLQYTIGYGLGARYFRVLWWFGLFTLIGFFVLLVSVDESNQNLFNLAWASFDHVLPIVELNEKHKDIIFGDYGIWVRTYFYIQKLIGYVLGGFLGAGWAGLTQRD
jgi:hypothetical protein